MAGTIVKIKQSSVAGRLPTHNTGNATDILQGELALNTADQILYSKDGSGSIFQIGGSSGGAAGANEIITTDFTATNAQTSFSVSYNSINDHVNVYYNGVKLSPDEYTATSGSTVVLDVGATTGSTISIEVIKALSLASGSDITDHEFTATASQTTFTITGGYNASNSDLDVFVNGIKIPAADYTATNGTTVVLGTACAVNDQVTVKVIKVAVVTDTVSQTSLTGAAIIPAGTTAQRDSSPSAGYLRWNSTIGQFEVYSGSAWVDINQLTDGEIKTAYENNSNTNAYTDAEKTKLSNIETSADVTDATNVAAAGAVMEADATTAAMSFVVDEDNMASDSATKLPTQQSVKAYVDAQVTAADLDFQGDSGGALSIDLDTETLDIAGGTGIDTTGATNTLTVAIDSTVATLTGTQILTNKTLTTPTITSGVINTGLSGSAFLDEDNMASNSATKVASQQSIKAYVDAQTTDETGEGSSNLYYTDARARAAFSAGTGISLSGAGAIAVTALALSTVQTAASQSAQLALTTQEGDVVVRSDENKSYVRNSGTAGTMADFTLLATPTDAVLSVNGQTGAISAAQIAAAVEAASNSNTFTDADHTIVNAAVQTTDTATTGMSFVVDEDNMSSNSATKLATQQSIKAYVDAQIQTVPDAVAMSIALG